MQKVQSCSAPVAVDMIIHNNREREDVNKRVGSSEVEFLPSKHEARVRFPANASTVFFVPIRPPQSSSSPTTTTARFPPFAVRLARAPLQHQWHLCVSLVVASPAMNTPIEELRCNECPFVGITRYLGQAVQQRCHRHSDSCMRWQAPALLPRLHLPLGTYCESPRALHTLVGALAVECIVLVLAVAPASCTQNACCDTSTMVSE